MSGGAPRMALVTWDAVARPHESFQRLADREDGAIARALEARGVAVDRVAWSATEVDWSAFELALVRTVWDYFDHLAEFRAWLERAGGLTQVWNRPEVVSWNADKSYLFDLEAAGVRLPPTERVAAGAAVDLAAMAADRGWDDVVVKKVVTGAAAGQARFRAGELAAGQAQAHLDALTAEGDALVQPYLASVAERGEISLVAVNGEVIHAVRKIPAPGDYRSQPNFGASAVLHRPEPAELELAARALAAVGQPTLHARVDMIALDDGAPALMELELIEPYLFLDVDPAAALRLADGIVGVALAGVSRSGQGPYQGALR